MITLEPINVKYANDTWRLRNNPKIWEYAIADAPLPATLSSEREFYLKMMNDEYNVMYSIIHEGTMIGAITLKKVQYGTCGIGYYILREDLWNRGIATQAFRLALEKAFVEKNVDLVYVWVNKDNSPSERILISEGLYFVGWAVTCEGVKRYEITRTNWKRKNEKVTN